MIKLALAALLLSIASAMGLAFGGVAQASNLAPGAEVKAVAPPLTDANRADCNAIRGSDYLSDEERSWFLYYCLGQGSQPVFQQIFIPPVTSFTPQQAPARPTAPAVRIVCSSSVSSAVADGDVQNVPMNAFAGEPIYCNAQINGSYTTVDWAGGVINGSGTNFVTSFDYRRTPWTIRVQINWGGNPVIKYVSVTTIGACQLPYGYGYC